MRKIVTAMVAGVLAGWASLSPAQAQTSQIGWVANLAGSCWQANNASGAQLERQCFQLQFNRFLRAHITRPNGYGGDTLLGYNTSRHRLELYSWSADDPPSYVAPEYDHASLVFTEDNARVIWRSVSADTFQVARQTSDHGNWTDRTVITYHRDGVAPPVFEANSGNSVASSTGDSGWLNSVAGHCFHQSEPRDVPANRGCLSWQYPHLLRQTWYWGSRAPSGEAVYYLAGTQIRALSWDAQGHFGINSATWVGSAFYYSNDSMPRQRSSLRPIGGGFTITTEVRTGSGADSEWNVDHTIRMRRDD